MAIEPFWIAKINSAEIAISPRPSAGTDMKGDIKSVAEGNTLLVSLLQMDEAVRCGLQNEQEVAKSLGVAFISLPIMDQGIPTPIKYKALVDELYSQSFNVDRIIIHCSHGIGRSSLVALGLMVKHGLDLKESIDNVKRIRGFDVPQSTSQKKLLSWYAGEISKE